MERNEWQMPAGFSCAGIAAGIKRAGRDLALMVSEKPAAAAGVFTTNRICAAPVKLCREHLRGGTARAIVVNSGIANACTGAAGLADARETAAAVARLLACSPEEVLVCSTGRIGPRLPMEKVLAGIETLGERLSPENALETAEAIMTTDTRPKLCARSWEHDGRPVRLLGLAKGAGMIEPNMATMLAFLFTDAAVEPAVLQEALRRAVDRSFNRISVDGDQSTNDTVLILAGGASGAAPIHPGAAGWEPFEKALGEVCFDLAMQIVHDGEGADRFVTVEVVGAVSDADADRAARAVADSLLNKTAWAGTYPNWGRVMDAIGYSGAEVEEEKVDVFYDDRQAVAGGVRADTPQEALVEIVSRPEFTIRVDLHLGEGRAVIYTCNCTEEYVRINVT